jgi:uncharacterized protein with ATP-grasp and redox domains
MPQRPQFPECKDCLLHLAGSAAQAVAHDPTAQASVEQAAKLVLDQGVKQGLRSPAIASRMLTEVRRLSGVDDPYAKFKAQEMALAKTVVEGLGANLPHDLRGLVSLAALGNSLDFFQDSQEVLKELAAKQEQGFAFHRDNIARLEKALESRPGLVLFLCDNAGEIYFDLPLVDHLRKSADRVVVVIKGGPAQNDLTRADLERTGLLDRVGDLADTGAEAAGIDWEQASPQFHGLVDSADLIIAKGMANYLSTIEHPLPCPAFFLFKLKCKPLRDLWEAPPDSFWAYWQEPSRD